MFSQKCVCKSKKKLDFTFFSLKNTVLEKPQVGVKLTPSLFRAKKEIWLILDILMLICVDFYMLFLLKEAINKIKQH